MPDTLPESQGQLLLMIGEIRGQLKELVHSVNNQGQLLIGLSDKVGATQGVPEKVKDNTAAIAALEIRVTALERVDARTEGAVGLGAWLIKLIPPAAFGASAAAVFKLMGG